MLGSGRNPAVLGRRDGADDESSRRAAEGDGEEDHLVGGGRDHRGDAIGRCGGGGSGLERDGYAGLADRRKGKPSAQRIPLATAEEVLRLYQETYYDLNIRHFHEKLREEHAIELSYTWVQKALQGAGLVAKRHKRGPHRRRRPRRPMPGMLLHIDGSKHRWLNDDRWYDLIVILDDATSEIYYAQLVEEESTRTVMAGLAGGDRNPGLILRAVQRPGESFLRHDEGGREGG